MTYEEAKAEFFSISGIRLFKWQEKILDHLYKLKKENPRRIIEIIRGGRGNGCVAFMLILDTIEKFRLNHSDFAQEHPRVVYLAYHHRKARVRKKNLKRLRRIK